jgi:hypothetical protein
MALYVAPDSTPDEESDPFGGICQSCYETYENCFHFTHRNKNEDFRDDCVVCKQDKDPFYPTGTDW